MKLRTWRAKSSNSLSNYAHASVNYWCEAESRNAWSKLKSFIRANFIKTRMLIVELLIWCWVSCIKLYIFSSILTKFGEGFNQYAFEKERTKYSNYINSVVGQNFYQVWERKSGYRSTLAKKWSNYTSQISNTYAKLEWELRMVRV